MYLTIIVMKAVHMTGITQRAMLISMAFALGIHRLQCLSTNICLNVLVFLGSFTAIISHFSHVATLLFLSRRRLMISMVGSIYHAHCHCIALSLISLVPVIAHICKCFSCRFVCAHFGRDSPFTVRNQICNNYC